MPPLIGYGLNFITITCLHCPCVSVRHDPKKCPGLFCLLKCQNGSIQRGAFYNFQRKNFSIKLPR